MQLKNSTRINPQRLTRQNNYAQTAKTLILPVKVPFVLIKSNPAKLHLFRKTGTRVFFLTLGKKQT